MKLDVLLSAMYLNNYDYIDTLNITGNCIIINQCNNSSYKTFDKCTDKTICYIETKERGLSKSRNMAIKNSTADICILCDNDVEYYSNYEALILEQYLLHPDYDVIVFHVTSPFHPKPIYDSARKLNYITCCKSISYEISFRRESIKEIKFNEQIGAGTKFKMGEENIFLYECLRRGLHVHYVPIEIAHLRYEQSTWNTGFDKDFFVSRGASFYAMTAHYSLFWIWQYAIRKHKYYKMDMSFYKALYYMLLGKRLYKQEDLCKPK